MRRPQVFTSLNRHCAATSRIRLFSLICLGCFHGSTESLRGPMDVVQQVGPIFGHRVEQLGDIAIEQQHADRKRWYAVSCLAVGTDADRPTGLFERGPWPAQSDIHRVAAASVDWAKGFNFLPLDVPRHQATIKNSALIQREDNS